MFSRDSQIHVRRSPTDGYRGESSVLKISSPSPRYPFPVRTGFWNTAWDRMVKNVHVLARHDKLMTSLAPTRISLRKRAKSSVRSLFCVICPPVRAALISARNLFVVIDQRVTLLLQRVHEVHSHCFLVQRWTFFLGPSGAPYDCRLFFLGEDFSRGHFKLVGNDRSSSSRALL